jgi:hypothetical protein
MPHLVPSAFLISLFIAFSLSATDAAPLREDSRTLPGTAMASKGPLDLGAGRHPDALHRAAEPSSSSSVRLGRCPRTLRRTLRTTLRKGSPTV